MTLDSKASTQSATLLSAVSRPTACIFARHSARRAFLAFAKEASNDTACFTLSLTHSTLTLGAWCFSVSMTALNWQKAASLHPIKSSILVVFVRTGHLPEGTLLFSEAMNREKSSDAGRQA